MKILDPGNSHKIENLWAWLSQDDDGNEGVCAFCASDGTWMPMVAADEDRLASLRPLAEALHSRTNRRMVLVKMTTRENVEHLE